MARLHVIVPTIGRPELIEDNVRRMFAQSRPPDGMLVVGTSPKDVGDFSAPDLPVQIVLTEKGLCRQRNRGIDLVVDKSDIIVFFDDDFVPAEDYLANVERLFELHENVVGITGELVDDGIRGDAIAFDEAERRLDDEEERPDFRYRRCYSLYGCNMALRVSALGDLRFDEALPLYGWQEDVDLTYQLSRRGEMISTSSVTGIHLGSRGGRLPGKRLGYSQIANIVYLWRKGTMRPGLGQRLIAQNVLSNIARSIRPERHIDRRGRLMGNMLACFDLARGRLDTRRIESM
ncbi:glycosyltransferase [Stakelama sediminis]|uniref:GT2 family glycosyltransferase n=1 Tax=Stakelama sediminis TaxID=463200 RepID=A0A840Z2P5_9SPHN|nr:glycosyltransferase family 2 protein [Stakelama sediminis]MBB5719976.1 GT2 family glycosyltransferase [Stakelama sediminis]